MLNRLKTHASRVAPLLALQVLDVISTNAALAQGAVEANPIVAYSMAALGSYWWLPKVAIAAWILAAIWLVTKRGGDLPHKAIVAATLFYSVIVPLNFLNAYLG